MFRLIIIFVIPLAHCVYVPNPENTDNRAGGSFGYTAADGPLTWPTTFATCAGSQQSPINIVPGNAVTERLNDFTLTDYGTSISGKLENTGSSLKFSITGGSAPTITGGRLEKDTFEFAQFHWHWGSVSTQGSEHTLDSKEYPAELHLVHFNKKYGDISTAVTKSDGLAVLGFFYEVSAADNANLATFLNQVSGLVTKRKRSLEVDNYILNYNKTNPYTENLVKQIMANIDNYIGNESTDIKSNRTFDDLKKTWNSSKRQARQASLSGITLNQLLPDNKLPTNYYYYQGSLTTPTCDESVLWTVFPTTNKISETQLAVLRTLTSSGVTLNDNYRPPQPLNGRTVNYREGINFLQIAGSAFVVTSLAALSVAFGAAILGGGAGFTLPSIPTFSNNRNIQDLEEDNVIIQQLSEELTINNVRK